MEDNYVVYHLHDDTSNCNGFADSCTHYDEYVKLAKKQNMKAIAFSNHGGIYDWVKKKQCCDKNGIKYIHGVELYLCNKLEDNNRGWHIGLYAKNLDGVKELNTLMSVSTSKGKNEDNTDRHFYFNPRISLDELFSTSDNIIITTACLASPLWRLSDKNIIGENNENIEIYNQNIKLRDKLLKWLSENNHRCFLEVQYHNSSHQIKYNQMLYQWSQEYGIQLIAGTDTHSSTKYKAECREVLQKSKDSFYGEEDEFDLTWKSYDELIECFKVQNSIPEEAYKEAVKNTIVFADMIDDFKLDKSFKYPSLYGENANEKWKKLIARKFKEKIDRKEIDINKYKEYKKVINEEFIAMSKQSMESFMMFMSELMEWARKNNIHSSPCRGSVGGSLIAYITDITDVDPLVWGTVFSRFCNADRISLADIDQDFAPNDREKVYQYIIDRFGNKNVSYILSLGTIQDRGSIDVLAKGLGYKNLEQVKQIKNAFDEAMGEYTKVVNEFIGDLKELAEVENLTSIAVNFDDCEIYAKRILDKKKVKVLRDCKNAWDKLRDDNKDLFYYFDGIKGTIISKGNHPAGMIGSPITLYDNLGVFYKGGDENYPVSFCSMKAVDSLNYVKFDILGLKTIGIIQDALRLANIDWKYSYQINWNDKKVWNDMIRCNAGIFQFEGDYAHDLLTQMINSMNNNKIDVTINHMSMVNAALRPSGKSYRDKLVNGEINKNPSKEIDTLLESNNGYLIFQEDTIKFLTDICGFSGSLADTTRRAIGKKDIELLNEQLPKILEGYCEKSTQTRDIAEQEAKQFVQIISDSSDYQFGYNHSTGYSMLGYMSSYIRTYHTLEYITSYFNWAENNDDIKNGMKMIDVYGCILKPPTFGYSKGEYFFDRSENAIYKGIASIKWCNHQIGEELYNLSQLNTYSNFVDLLVDISKTSITSRQLKILTGLDFFRQFGKNKKLLNIIDIFDLLIGRKQINYNKGDIKKLNINESILQKYSKKKTDTLYKDIDMVGYIKDVSNRIEDKPLSAKEQIKFELTYLEYVSYINEKAGDNFYAVIDFKTYQDDCKPYVVLRQINSGIEFKSKVTSKKSFQERPFQLFSILKVNEFREQKKRKKVNDEWVLTDDLEKILIDWEVY